MKIETDSQTTQKTFIFAVLIIQKQTMSKDTKLPADKRKAQSKFFSKHISGRLVTSNSESELRKGYSNSYYCSETLLLTEDKMLKSKKYCKNRWCIICNRIKTAQLIDGYAGQLVFLKELHFVTLTMPTCRTDELSKRLLHMNLVWRKIKDLARNKKFDKLGIHKPIGLRKTECTLRPNDYVHCHFHVLINTRETAEWLRDQWLAYNPQSSIKAQDIRPVRSKNNHGTMKEMLYCAMKEVTKYLLKMPLKINTKEAIRMDKVFIAFRGKRLVQPFGGLKKVDETMTEEKLEKRMRLPDDIEGRKFNWKQHATDWITEFGEPLTGYEPSEKVLKEMGYQKKTIEKTQFNAKLPKKWLKKLGYQKKNNRKSTL